jgi:prevent-host-death family protein
MPGLTRITGVPAQGNGLGTTQRNLDYTGWTDQPDRVKQVNVYEARGQFSRLLEEAEAGEEIVIARNGKPIVRLVPVNLPKRTFGRWREQVRGLSDEEWKASDEAVAALFAASVSSDR